MRGQLGQLTQIGWREILWTIILWDIEKAGWFKGMGRAGRVSLEVAGAQRFLGITLLAAGSSWLLFLSFGLFVSPALPLTYQTASTLTQELFITRGRNEQQCGCLEAGWGHPTTLAKLFHVFWLFLYPFLPAQQPVAQSWSSSLLRDRTEGHHMESNSLLP